MMDQGPILVITFTAQQVMCARNSFGEVVEGDPVSVRKCARIIYNCFTSVSTENVNFFYLKTFCNSFVVLSGQDNASVPRVGIL